MRALAFALGFGMTWVGGPAHAQSLFGSVGLGLPVDAVDGRGRALGNVGLGLSGVALLPSDPAAAARARIPSAVLVAQPSWADASDGSQTNYFRGTRFPLLAAAYPILGGVATLHFTTHLDQDFSGVRETQLTLAGQPVVARDAFNQDGSVSSMNVGFARMLTEELSVGLSVGRYTGTVDRTLIRTVESGSATTTVQPYISNGSWSYSGYRVTGGVATRVTEIVHVAASATWSTELDASASSSTPGGDGSFAMPLQLRLGASASLAPGLTLSASAEHADWSSVADDLNGADEVDAALAFGVGLELAQARLAGRSAPIRLGFRRSSLPFALGTDSASERIFSGGLGLVLAQAGEIVLANVDLGVERGRRSAGALQENFWRATLSLRLAGL